MPYPRAFRDDGQVVHLDLHGCTIADGLTLVRRTLMVAARHGRARLDVVHGYSTSTSPYEPTLRNALRDAWEEGDFDAWVADVRWDESGGRCAMWLKLGIGKTNGPISLANIA